MKLLLLIAMASELMAGTFYRLTPYNRYDFWKDGSTVLSLDLSGEMTQDSLSLDALTVGGTQAGWYSPQFGLSAAITAPDLGTMYQNALSMIDQPAVHGPDHANTIMFDFSQITGGGLEIGQDRMGMVYRYGGRVMVNFWMGSALTSVPQPDLLNVGDAIFYADPIHTPEVGSRWLWSMGVAVLAVLCHMRGEPGCVWRALK